MLKNIFCIFADNPGGYCKNENVKRSLFGIGARCCVKYFDDHKDCIYYEEPDYTKIIPPPPPPPFRPTFKGKTYKSI